MHSHLTVQRGDELPPDPELAMTPEPPLRSLRVLRLRDLERKVGLKKTQIYGLMTLGQFPKPLKLTERAIGWLEHEVDDFIRARAAHRTTHPQRFPDEA